MSSKLRTLLRHERTPPFEERGRGERHWSAVQLLSPTWFFVESSDIGDGHVHRWITTSMVEAANIQRGLEPVKWARIFVCLHASQSVNNGTLFEEIDEAYQVGNSTEQMFQLTNGMCFVVGAESTKVPSTEPKEVKLLYHRKAVRQGHFAM